VNTAAGTLQPRWRTVTTKYLTDDVVVAGYSVQDFGAVADGKTDDTALFQQALDAMGAAGGGTVFAPAGRYVIRGRLTIPMGVVLRGDWQKPAPGKPLVGTILMAYAGRGDASGDPFIDLQLSSGIMDMAIWYPDQDPNTSQPDPYTIRHKSGYN
jgi:hypothetical protein